MPRLMESSSERANDQRAAELCGSAIAEFDHLRIVVFGIDMQQREADPLRKESLFGQVQQNCGILAARKQQGGIATFSRYFAKDEDGFCFQRIEMAEVAVRIRVVLIEESWNGRC